MKHRSTARASTRPVVRGQHAVAPAQFAVAAPLAAAAVVAVAVLVYLPALRNGFIWDDPLVLRQLRAIRTWGDLVIMPPQIPRYYYRPLIFVSYLVDRALGGEAPFWFHLSVVAFHALNCLLVFRLAQHLFRDDVTIAAGTALVLAVV